MVMRKRCSFDKVPLMEGPTFPVGKLVMNSARAKPFLVFGVENSILNSCRIMIHQENLLEISHQPSI